MSGWRGAATQRIAYALFATGLMLGGIVSAITLWLISGIADPLSLEARFALFASIGVAALLRDVHVISFPIPQRAQQIPRTVFERGLALAAVQFGFELGTGARTHVTATTPYIVAAAIVLHFTGFYDAVAVGVGFGIGRALMPSVRALSGTNERWDTALRQRIGWLVPVASGSCIVGVAVLI